MRAIFSILGLLVVVAITGMLVKKQFAAHTPTAIKAQDGSEFSMPTTTPGATPQQQSLQIQQQVKQSVEASLQQARQSRKKSSAGTLHYPGATELSTVLL